jgi:hypothetical protein
MRFLELVSDLSAFFFRRGREINTGDKNITTNQLILDQGAGDGKTLSLRSSDFDDGVAQGMTDEEYFYIAKKDGATAGATLKAAGDSYEGMVLIGSGAAASSTSGQAPMTLVGRVDDTTIDETDNVMSIKNHATPIVNIKGDGDMYILGTYETFDHLASDVEMVRAESLQSPNAIRTKFDNFVRYNRNDLEAAGLVDGAFVNTTGMMRLHSGALWQLHQRIAELEAQMVEVESDD